MNALWVVAHPDDEVLGRGTKYDNFPQLHSLEALTATAQRWGSVIGCKAAEAFEAAFVIQ
jgi:hypothetical protein